MTAGTPPATEFTVNSSGDTSDGTCNAAHCTLREAINAANTDPGVETIRFEIGTGPVTIAPTSALPVVTEPVVLDATTQPGYSGVPLIRLDGVGAGASTPGFEIQGGGTTVRGFSITNFTWDGVKMEDGDGNTVEDNWLGVRLNGDGVAAAGNGTYGVLADFGSAGNVIRRNLIGGNGFGTGGPYSGIGIWHAAADNVVEDNDVGFGPGLLGGESLPNAIGVIIAETTGTRLSGNTITNSTGPGVWVFGSATSGNAITANLIHSNGGLGIDLGPSGVTANDAFDADTGANDLQNFPGHHRRRRRRRSRAPSTARRCSSTGSSSSRAPPATRRATAKGHASSAPWTASGPARPETPSSARASLRLRMVSSSPPRPPTRTATPPSSRAVSPSPAPA